MKRTERLAKFLHELELEMAGFHKIPLSKSLYSSKPLIPGEFRTHSRKVMDIERDAPRVFTMDDDPTNIDLGRLPQTICYSLAHAALQGDLRLIQSVKFTESEFIAIIDLSRSMLANCFGEEERISPQNREMLKLRKLYFVASAFLYLAEFEKFILRAICARGRNVHQDRTRIPKEFARQVTSVMSNILIQSHSEAEKDFSDKECLTTLETGIITALSVRVRSVVLIVSDFLDPFSSYGQVLNELIGRHFVILADVALKEETEFPSPGFLHFETQRVLYREGARHVELGTEPKNITRKLVHKWNFDQLKERRQLREIIKKNHVPYINFSEMSLTECYRKILYCFDLLK
jgi:hypothetical protein